ncbi:MAG TPA: ATP-binding protein [Streptosporangiaceae bacterium]|nr:ATP-binding protein [Streptosporangiaceae bacterium]
MDASCAATARQLFRTAAAGIGLPDDVVCDGVTMASELAANSMHAGAAAQFDGALGGPVTAAPELWLYLRRAAGQQELVCKVFDALPGWANGRLPDPLAAVPADDAESGRGLHVVHALSHGRWGHHLTRARLGGWKVSGKAVWFAQPVPPGSVLDRFRRAQLGSLEAAEVLERMLSDRGLAHIVRADAPASGMSVMSIRRELTVWIRSRVVSWTSRSGHREWREFSDLVDAAEQIVCAHEELASADRT